MWHRPRRGSGTTCPATVAAVLATLRLQGGDVDTVRIQAIVPAAARSIDNELDRITVLDGPPPDPLIQYELERRTINLYQANIPIAAIGAVPSWLPESGSVEHHRRFGNASGWIRGDLEASHEPVGGGPRRHRPGDRARPVRPGLPVSAVTRSRPRWRRRCGSDSATASRTTIG